jgi:hypothetical protein
LYSYSGQELSTLVCVYFLNNLYFKFMEKLIEALEEYQVVINAFTEMNKKMDKTLDNTISSLKLIMEQYDK